MFPLAGLRQSYFVGIRNLASLHSASPERVGRDSRRERGAILENFLFHRYSLSAENLADLPLLGLFVAHIKTTVDLGFDERETFLAVRAHQSRSQFASNRVTAFRAQHVSHVTAYADSAASFWLWSSHKRILPLATAHMPATYRSSVVQV
jgi:hypothetical protein